MSPACLFNDVTAAWTLLLPNFSSFASMTLRLTLKMSFQVKGFKALYHLTRSYSLLHSNFYLKLISFHYILNFKPVFNIGKYYLIVLLLYKHGNY